MLSFGRDGPYYRGWGGIVNADKSSNRGVKINYKSAQSHMRWLFYPNLPLSMIR